MIILILENELNKEQIQNIQTEYNLNTLYKTKYLTMIQKIISFLNKEKIKKIKYTKKKSEVIIKVDRNVTLEI
jgi:hypothetical protein